LSERIVYVALMSITVDAEDAGTLTPVSAHLASRRLTQLLAAMAALDTMAVDMYASSFPALGRQFGISSNAVQGTMSIFLLGAALGQLVLGPLLDHYGRRGPILAGMGCFVLGSLLCAVAPGYEVFMVGRLVQSLGAATALVAPRAVLADIYSAKEMARAFSVLMQIMMIAPVVSPILGASLLTHFGWRSNFFALTLFGAAHFAACWIWLPETLPRSHRIVRRPLGVAKAFVGLLVHRRFAFLMISGGCIAGSLYAFLGASPFAFISGYGVTTFVFSLIMAGISITLIGFGWINIRLLVHFSESRILTAGLVAQLAAGCGLALLAYVGSPTLLVYLVLLAIAIGALGIIFPNVSALAMAQSGRDAGLASAAVGIVQSGLGAAAGVVLAFTGTGALGMMVAIALFAALALAAKEAAR
jgi:DHA1 family bicyclomycin/chloramphenicol resistance-like MFS transporter